MTALKLTDRQARATQPASHVWVDASAGTGKTHVLTARVLRLLVEGARPDSILCLTYTKAAAAEMVSRIIDRLGNWAVWSEDALKGDLAALLGGASLVEPGHMTRAKSLFLDVLDLPGGLAIQTLHAFSQSLLGRFPLESATAPSFETIDDRTAKEYAADARTNALAKALEGDDADLGAAATRLAKLLADTSFEGISEELLSMRRALTSMPQGLLAIRQRMHQALDVPLGKSEQDLLKAACAAPVAGLGEAAGFMLQSGSKTDRARGEIIKTWLQADDQEGDRVAGFDAYCAAYLVTGGDAIRKRLMTKGPQEERPDIADTLMAEAARLLAVRQEITLKRLAEDSALAVTYGQALSALYTQRKQQAGTLDFTDLIDRTQALLAGQVPPDWVLYRLDSQIEHILIDEAQDNSALQWQIVEKLSEDFFTGAGQIDSPRSVFAVGDMKQSIYGFQGAEPTLFNDSKMSFKGKAGASKQRFEDVGLAKSFRSVDAVLRVVDETFAGEAGDGLDAQRVQIRHDSHRTGAGGMVDVWPLTVPKTASDEEDEEEEPRGWRLPLVERIDKKPDQILAEDIASDIAQRIARRECLPGRSVPLGPGDFLILARRRSDLMGYIARGLKRRGVPIAGLDRFDLKSPLAVRDLVNLARFASLPEDDYALACTLKSPLCNVSEDSLLALCAGRPSSLWQAVKASSDVSEEAKTLLRGALSMADYAPPFEFFSHILERGGRTRLLKRLGQEAGDAITVFLNQCLVYERSHTAALDGFLHWFSQSDVDVKRDPEAAGDQVRIMTIHGAKGLQAPVVYLADLASKPETKSPFVILPHQGQQVPILRRHKGNDVGPVLNASLAAERQAYEEYKRLVYVAMTRAEDHLICCGYAGKAREAPVDAGAQPDGYDLISAAFHRLGVKPDARGIRRFETAQRAPVTAPPKAAASRAPSALPEWANRPAPPEESPPRPLQPSQSADQPQAPFKAADIGGSGLSPARRGTLIHALLQHLPKLPTSDRASAGHAYLKAMAPEVTASELLEEALKTLALPDMEVLLGPDSRAEVPIMARLGSYVVSGVIDRLAVRADEVLFADFKTTQLPPDEGPPDILRQMALYQLSLERIYPGKPVRGAIIWTATGRIDWPEKEDLAAHLPPSVYER